MLYQVILLFRKQNSFFTGEHFPLENGAHLHVFTLLSAMKTVHLHRERRLYNFSWKEATSRLEAHLYCKQADAQRTGYILWPGEAYE